MDLWASGRSSASAGSADLNCAQFGCGNTARARGLCTGHYQAAKRSGVLPEAWGRAQRSPEPMRMKLERGRHIDKETGCWEWTGRVEDGYGRVPTSGSRYVRAHRAAYEIWTGPIPKELEIDHVCRNRRCFNPDHLEAVTHKENVRRGALPEMMREKAARLRNQSQGTNHEDV